MVASIALTSLAVASYVIAASTEPRRPAIALHKRGPPLSKAGTVVGAGLPRHLAGVKRKYSLGASSIVLPDANLLGKRQNAHLAYQGDIFWVGEIFIGTPGQPFLVMFDTQSSDIWVPSALCQAQGCGRHRYHESKSTTGHKEDGSFEIKYADLSTMSGPVYSETVTVTGLNVTRQHFSPVTSETDSLSGAYDGIMGLGFQNRSIIGEPLFIDNLYSQGKISSPTFAMRLASSDSELYIGGTNRSRYTGTITWSPLHDDNRDHWMVAGSINVDDTVVFSGKMAIDSTASVILGSPSTVKAFWSKVAGYNVCSPDVCEGGGFYTFPCEKVPKNVSFTFSGRKFPISADDLILGPTDTTKKTCVGSIVAVNWLIDTAWILGGPFLKNVYAVFQKGDKKNKAGIGFATPA